MTDIFVVENNEKFLFFGKMLTFEKKMLPL